MSRHFDKYHPLVNFLFFFLVIGNTMLVLHPIYMAISLVAAFIFSVIIGGRKALKFDLVFAIPAIFVLGCINPMFNHEGATILFYLKSGNPFTLESVVYGFAASTMLVTVIMWFSSYNKIMSSDKFIYLFGKIIPATSLILSMVLRFVPLYKMRIKEISMGQRAIGNDVTQGNIVERARNGIKILSIMTTWSLENGIETANSMKSRGYGLPGRTAYSSYIFTTRDLGVIVILLICEGIVLISGILEITYYTYFPLIAFGGDDVLSILSYMAYFVMCFVPILITIWEEYKWKYLISKI